MSGSKRPEKSVDSVAGELARLSRTLLFPGPLPPSSHFGVTLLRHVVATGLRSTLHRLGLPLIPAAPVRIVGLRLYLDHDALARELASAAGGSEAIGALIDPGGVAALTQGGARLMGAGLLHRARLRRRPKLRPTAAARSSSFEQFRATLSALLPTLSDAILADLLGALARRRERAAGHRRPPCLSREAWRFHAGRAVSLDYLGPPEPLLSSWAMSEPVTPPPGDPPPSHRFRGRFREQYRAALDLLVPSYRQLAGEATERGLLDDPSDAFFIPLDLAEDLTADKRPDWLESAVATNRREYMSQRTALCPPDLIDPDSDTERDIGPVSEAWALCPLNPLP